MGKYMIAPTSYASRPADSGMGINQGVVSRLVNSTQRDPLDNRPSKTPSLLATVTYENWLDYLASKGVLGSSELQKWWSKKSNPRADVPDQLYDEARLSGVKPAELRREEHQNKSQKPTTIDDAVENTIGQSRESYRYDNYVQGEYMRARQIRQAAHAYFKSLLEPLARVFERIRNNLYKGNPDRAQKTEDYDPAALHEIEESIFMVRYGKSPFQRPLNPGEYSLRNPQHPARVELKFH